MAGTPTIQDRTVFGDRKVRMLDFLFDSSYPIGGEALSLAQVELNDAIDLVLASGAGGYDFEWDYVNLKLKATVPVAKFTANVNPGAPGANALVDTVIAVTGIAATDEVVGFTPPVALEATLVAQAVYVSAVSEITVTLQETAGGTPNGADLAWDFYVCRANGAAHEVPEATDLSAVTARLMVVGK